jgi:arylsulfatase B
VLERACVSETLQLLSHTTTPPLNPHPLTINPPLQVHRRASSMEKFGVTSSAQAMAEAVTTPNLDSLADEGILLTHHIAYKICAPSRSALQSGRLPVHVNWGNTAPTAHNPEDPVSGYAGIPRNMTTMGTLRIHTPTPPLTGGQPTMPLGQPMRIVSPDPLHSLSPYRSSHSSHHPHRITPYGRPSGTKLKEAGYRTHFYGKWDVGMATPEHTPLGRGYEDSLFFYHHANNYYSSGVELEATGEVTEVVVGVALW